jgi:hypothetical protein
MSGVLGGQLPLAHSQPFSQEEELEMKYREDLRMPRSFIIICLGLMVLASVPMLSRAHPASSSVSITNNSGREIRSVYTSHVNADDWGSNLLSSTLAAGQSATVNFNCDAQQIKVIAEDQDGCFESTIINCGDNANWTITTDTARDCG